MPSSKSFFNFFSCDIKSSVNSISSFSTFLGFLVAWTCINYSQSSENLIHPVTCLWIVAIPLLDCLGVMAGRAIKGILPFSPGRDHIHHKLQNITGSSSKTLIGLLTLGSLVAGVGIIIEKTYLSPEFSFMLFIIFALLFYFGSGRLSNQVKGNV